MGPKNKFLKTGIGNLVEEPLVVAHATGGMVVDADGEGIAVEADIVGQRRMATGLKSNPDCAAGPREGMKPLED